MNTKKINILICDDSAVIRQLLNTVLKEAEDINVIGYARDGIEAVQMTQKLKPDLITMDIEMPGIDGFEATKKIMSEFPTPIIVISSHVNTKEMNTTFNALTAGALTVIEKPHDILSAGFLEQKRNLFNLIRALSQVHVIRRRADFMKKSIVELKKEKQLLVKNEVKIMAFGASTGGPAALHYILSRLPKFSSVPIVIVQHITDNFLPGLVNWLQMMSSLKIEIVQKNRQPLLPGTVYFAPDGFHLTIKKDVTPIAVLENSPAIEYFKPSVTRLFSSIAESYPGLAVAGLLTGMGRDGAVGLLQMKQSGCHTFVQNQESSVVFGMPSAAKNIQAECDTIDLTEIPEYINQIFNKEKENG